MNQSEHRLQGINVFSFQMDSHIFAKSVEYFQQDPHQASEGSLIYNRFLLNLYENSTTRQGSLDEDTSYGDAKSAADFLLRGMTEAPNTRFCFVFWKGLCNSPDYAPQMKDNMLHINLLIWDVQASQLFLFEPRRLSCLRKYKDIPAEIKKLARFLDIPRINSITILRGCQDLRVKELEIACYQLCFQVVHETCRVQRIPLTNKTIITAAKETFTF